MAVEAIGSRFARNNALIFCAACLIGGAWFGYDGWLGSYRQEQLDDNNGKPTVNLLFNQYVPIPLAIAGIYFLFAATQIPKRRLVADEKGLTVQDRPPIPYSDITHIDNRHFEKSGYFLLGYNDGGRSQELKFSDRKYDNLGLLLDELVQRTGAKPQSEVKSDSHADT